MERKKVISTVLKGRRSTSNRTFFKKGNRYFIGSKEYTAEEVGDNTVIEFTPGSNGTKKEN